LLLILCVLAAAVSSAAAQPIHLDVQVREDPWAVTVGCTIRNRDAAGIREVVADLWHHDGDPLEVGGALGAGAAGTAVWQLDPAAWRDAYRQLAAVRVRYIDAAGRSASVVAVAGRQPAARVTPPHWPDELRFGVSLDHVPARRGRVEWWSASELAVIGPAEWHDAGNGLELQAELSPSSQIAGVRTTVHALLVPASGAGPGLAVAIPVDATAAVGRWPDVTPIVWAYIALSVVVWIAWSRTFGTGARRRTDPASGIAGEAVTPSERLLARLPAAMLAICLGATALVVVPPALVFSNTTPAGGDFISHVVAFDYLRRELLPSGRIYGWFPGWYAGFPLFLMYFPLAFLVDAVLAMALPLGVAMKAGSLLGCALLPYAWFRAMRWLGAPREASCVASAASLTILLSEWQSVWGANLASTLAGEFAYALGFPLAWLAMARAWAARDLPPAGTRVPVLLALTGLAHVYTLIAASVGAGLIVFAPARWRQRCWNVGWGGVLSFGLLAWWLIPVIWQLEWTTSARRLWPVPLAAILPPGLWPAVLLTGAGITRRARRIVGTRRVEEPAFWWLIALGFSMGALYVLGYSLGFIGLRMLPFLQGALVLAASWELGCVIAAAPRACRPAATSVAIVAITLAAVLPVRNVAAWIRWNFHGMEMTPRWRDFNGVMSALRASPGEPRVVAEYHADANLAGSPRAFELLPYFARRPTLEGLYAESSLLAPAAYVLQAELTERPTCQTPDFECAAFDPVAAIAHARLLGVDTIVAYTPRLRAALAASPDVERVARSGVYTIHRLKGSIPLAEPARFRPVVDLRRPWRIEAHDWFRAARDLDVPMVFGRAVSDRPAVDRYRPGGLPRWAYDRLPEVSVRLGPQSIRLRTTRPLHPVLVKVAYHPGWRASDGSVIELTAPGFMLVTPNTTDVILTWGAGWAGRGGLGLSLVTVLLLSSRRFAARLSVRQPLPERGRIGVGGVALTGGLAAILGTAIYLARPPVAMSSVVARGLEAMSRKDLAAAEAAFVRVMTERTAPERDEAVFYHGLAAEQSGRPTVARERWERFLDEYPVSMLRVETLVRLSRLDVAAGDLDRARGRLERAMTEPLAGPGWRAIAREELARLSARPG
jgi:hypothetical protein